MTNQTITTTVNLTRKQINNQPRVTCFLNVMGRNSLKTKKNYETGLVHFQGFLNSKYHGKHSLENIVDAISFIKRRWEDNPTHNPFSS